MRNFGRAASSNSAGSFRCGASAAALALIGGGSLFKIAQLAGGGTVVAERLGGRRVYPNTTDPDRTPAAERRRGNGPGLGRARAARVSARTKKQGINAFAAGFSPSDAVVGVTRGCAEQLTRDQLQGVIAHEFSHILNGDMRLNLRLIGVLHGILLMGLVGPRDVADRWLAAAAARLAPRQRRAVFARRSAWCSWSSASSACSSAT